jgi:hypothetical protein
MISFVERIRYRAGKSKMRVPLVWLQHRGLHPEDVLLASYPRSGSTWLRFVLLEILSGQSAGFENVNDTIPEIGTHRQGLRPLQGGGRLIKTHEQYRREYKRAIYLLRDPRDVMLSVYAVWQAIGRADYISGRNGFDGFLLSFLRGQVTKFGTWQDHVTGWLTSPLAGQGNLLVVKFEEMRRNTEDVLARILEFLRFPPDRKAIERAIANNSLEQMRAKEDSAKTLGIKVSAPLLFTKADPRREESRFVRRGAVGGWREKLTPEQVQLFSQRAGRALKLAGYPAEVEVDPNRAEAAAQQRNYTISSPARPVS